MSVVVDIQVACDAATVPSDDEIRWWLSHAVNAVRGPATDAVEVSVRIVDEAEGRELNSHYRQGNRATNVLSFPADAAVQTQLGHGTPKMLGDVVICGPVVEREAADQGKDPASHWSHLLVHGALHLLGYDHKSDAEAQQMEALERELLAKRGIEDPYAVA